ncbi:hypothetical protein [Dyella ginsengisoli]|uniref:hypothetical protein n=1 Tax=Dyella ginsengisoli TaxID=363848 RepID=UPI00034736B9|nr:hypothetical protein [Dyella ginsengisoli]
MNEKYLKHPELISGPNPLLEALAPFIPFNDLPRALIRQPLERIDWKLMAPGYRNAFLDLHEKHYWPTSQTIEVAESIQAVIRSGLVSRNPLSGAEQRRINALALTHDVEKIPLQSLRTPAGGGVISAMTGMGKSATLLRALEAVAPEQVVIHSKSEQCGWSILTQLLYLVIDGPFNGTPGGLLSRITESMDIVLGTDYSDECRKKRNLDAQLLFVTKLLSTHRVGLLAIDENQLENFEQSIWRKSLVLFFLGLMNLGIPILLLGNPLAFASLKSFSQNVRRLSTIGHHEMTPAATAFEPWWARDFVPGMCRFALCEEIPSVGEIVDTTFDVAGGVPGIFAPLWIEAQRISLRRGGGSAQLQLSDLVAARRSPRVVELLNIAQQASGASPVERFVDIPKPASPTRGAAFSTGVARAPDVSGGSQDLRAHPSPISEIQKALERRRKAGEYKAKHQSKRAEERATGGVSRVELQLEMFAGLEGTQEPLISASDRARPKKR